MKQYNNGQRKGMMYGGVPRKPMMYGGKAKKMQMGGTAAPKKKNAMEQSATTMPMTSSPMMPAAPMQTAQQRTPMAEGGKAFAALAAPYDKATYADKIAGAKKGK
jgi:hypothetical protein